MSEKYFEQSPERLKEFLELIEEDLENVRRVIDFCEKKNLDVDFKVHQKAGSASESSENTGITPEKIVKTLVFKAGEDFIAVLCPGDRKVSEQKLEDHTGKKVRMARPEEVEAETGYLVGGVSPFDLEILIYMEESLLNHDNVKPAAGSRVVGLQINPKELEESVADKSLELTQR